MRAACYPPDSLTPLAQLRRPTEREDPSGLTDRLIDLIASVWPEEGEVEAIGVASPGPLNPYTGVILNTPNIPGWENVPLVKILQDRFEVPVALGNDANLAALGEWRYGAGQGHHHLLYLTVSTGIGGGVILDDRLLVGASGMGAELGHVTALPDGPVCSCGQPGHLEAVAAGLAIARWVGEQIALGEPSSLAGVPNLTAKAVSQDAQSGDPLAIQALERAGTFIGRALADFCHIFNPTIILIGGGVSQSGPLLFEPIKAALHQHILTPEYLENLTITAAQLGDDAGLLGALALARGNSE